MIVNAANGRILVLCDFDGTICTADMGNEILKRFTTDGWKDIDGAYCRGEIGSRDAYAMISPLFRGKKEEVLEYVIARDRIDPYFVRFFAFCRDRGIDLKITSDGLDFYIETVLKRHGLSEIEFFSNAAVFQEDETLAIEFPLKERCCEKCGTCKKSIVKQHRDAFDLIIYVGDGYSDVCPAKEADLVFAKGILYEHCSTNGTPCIRYSTFADVERHLCAILPSSPAPPSQPSRRGYPIL